MSSQQINEILEVGIDYITATQSGPPSTSSLASFGTYLVGEEESRGHTRRAYRASGYQGTHAGGAATGRRYDGAIVRLSGPTAAEHWEQVVSMSTNVSRLDVQVTLCPGEGVKQRLLKHIREIKTRPKGEGRPFKWHLHSGPEGPECLELNRRISDRFGRIYDKHLQSGLDCYRGALRYEIELKRKVAWASAKHFDGAMDHELLMLAEIINLLRSRRCLLSIAGVNSRFVKERTLQFQARVRACADVNLRLLNWLEFQIKPSVQKLIAAGYCDEVQASLGISSGPELWPTGFRPPTWAN